MNHSRSAVNSLFLTCALLALASAASAQIHHPNPLPGHNPQPHGYPPTPGGDRSGLPPLRTPEGIGVRRSESHRRNIEELAADLYIRAGDDALKKNPPQYTEAEEAYASAVRLRPRHVTAREKLGEVYAAQRRYEEAARTFQDVLEIKPKRAEAHYRLGLLYHEMGDADAARRKLGDLRALKKAGLVARLEAALNQPPASQ